MKQHCFLTTTLMAALVLALALGGCAGFKAKMGQGMAGTWQLEVATPSGIGTPLFQLKQQGNKLSGTYQGAFGEAPLQGEVNGSDFVIRFTNGSLPMTYTGQVAGDIMEGFIDFGGQGEGTFVGRKN